MGFQAPSPGTVSAAEYLTSQPAKDLNGQPKSQQKHNHKHRNKEREGERERERERESTHPPGLTYPQAS